VAPTSAAELIRAGAPKKGRRGRRADWRDRRAAL